MYRITLPKTTVAKPNTVCNIPDPMLGQLIQRVKEWMNPSDALKTIHPASTISTSTSPSSLVPQQVSSTAPALRTVKLIMVTAENNNKFYEMNEKADGTFTVQYGRVGGTKSVATYPIAQWNKKLREKVAKGYVDQTDLYADKALSADANTITNPAVRDLMNQLLEFANRSIFQNYVVTAQQVTRKQVEKAQQVLDELAAMVDLNLDVEAFNNKLLELFKTIPRKMGKVNEHLVQQLPYTASDLQPLRDQLATEQDTLDVMRGQVEINQPKTQPNQPPPTLLESMNLTVEPVTDSKVLTLIHRMMGPDAKKFDAAFSVRQSATESAFQTHLAQSENPKTQLLWHGSRSENWMSILRTGLVLRPANAIITGKMFGYGIYFADQFSKSLNYTSLVGSTWANGRQQEGYLAIYEVHVGNQLVVTRHENWHTRLDASALQNIDPKYNSVFARRGFSLLKNEFIVYNQAQSTVRYIVRIKV